MLLHAVGMGLHVDMTAYVFHLLFTLLPLSRSGVQSFVINMYVFVQTQTERDIDFSKSVVGRVI